MSLAKKLLGQDHPYFLNILHKLTQKYEFEDNFDAVEKLENQKIAIEKNLQEVRMGNEELNLTFYLYPEQIITENNSEELIQTEVIEEKNIEKRDLKYLENQLIIIH